MSKGVSITYGDVAPEAKENFAPTATDKKFDTLDNLKKYNMQLYNYAQPCEMYQTLLDGTATAFPSDHESANIGLWSNQLSNDIGVFSPAIQLTLTSTGQYSSQGFTFTFDKFNNIYPTSISIQWIRDTGDTLTTLDTKDFTPNNSVYFCKNAIENFNKVIILFKGLNMPYNRLKVECIDYGYGTVFYSNELRNVKISQSLDPISSEIAINTCDFTLDSKSDMNYSFQAKQPLTVMFDDKLIATTFVKNSKRTSRFLWTVNGEDYIGLMDNIPFVGGMYNNVMAGDLLETIFETAKVPYTIDQDFYSVPLYGYIPYTTCRTALMQVAFACMAVVDTSNDSTVKVFSLDNTVSQTVPLKRIMQGQSFTDEDTVTSVELTSHTYTAVSETIEAYKAEESGIGNGIIVKFSEPLHDLSIINGTIVTQGTNYAVINANENCVLTGGKYEHVQSIKRKINPTVLASELENIKSITNATLVSPNNVDNVLEKCYNWLIRTNSTNLKIIEGKTVVYGKPITWGEKKWGSFKWGAYNPDIITYDSSVNVGDKIKAETEYLDDVTGTIIKESYGLNGNIIVKEAVLK
jgi:hypothetical protein